MSAVATTRRATISGMPRTLPDRERLRAWIEQAMVDGDVKDDALAIVDTLIAPDELQAWHEAKGWDCVAHSEGQTCCVDELLERSPA